MSIYFKDIKVPSGNEYFWEKVLTNEYGKTWYIHTSGTVAVKYKYGKEKQLKPFINKKDLRVKIAGRDYKVKNLVAAAVYQNYKKGMSVICKDRNQANCDYNNLFVISNRQLGRMTGHMSKSKKVVIVMSDGSFEFYRSVREVAKALYVSYQTVLNYIGGNVVNSVLSGYIIKFTENKQK